MKKLSHVVDRLQEIDGVMLGGGEIQGVRNNFKDVGHIVVVGSRHARHLGEVSVAALELGIPFSSAYDPAQAAEATAVSAHLDAANLHRLVIMAPTSEPHDTMGALHSLNHLPNIYARATFEIE